MLLFNLSLMRRIFFIASCLVFLFSSCVTTSIKNYQFNQKQSANKLKEDVVLLKKILEANHPSLYWHTPKDTIDVYFNKAINNIQDSLNETDFRNVVAEVVSKIKCGHTSVRFSKDYAKKVEKNRYPQFPLLFKVWKDSLVVLASALPKDSIFKRGTVVTSINGKTNQQIIEKIFNYLSMDGNEINFKNQVLSNNFSAWYKLIWGLDSAYVITYIDTTGKEKTTVVKNFAPVKDTSKHKPVVTKPAQPLPPVQKITRREKKQLNLLAKRNFQIDTSINTAYIKLNTFSGGRLRKFFRQTFKKIREEKVENIVLDLRENGGGNVATSNLLSKYFADKSFKLGDTVKAISRKFEYKNHIKKWGMYWFAMNFFAHKEKDGFIHYKRFEKHYFKPKKKNHFNGQLYVVQGGFTFSASTMFISNIYQQKNVTLVGEPTGGGFYGNTAMHLPTIVLPNSKLRVVLPMYRLVMDKNRPKGLGIQPDVLVYPSSLAIKKGYDIKLQTVRKLILDRKNIN